jgi:hypothetical protein
MTFKASDVEQWATPRDLGELERALDGGRLYVRMTHSAYWQARRNGRTQTWVRDPARFRIPVKAGLRAYGEATPDNLTHYRVRPVGERGRGLGGI